MGYSNKFAIALKIAGQFIRELANGEVVIHFGSEYTIYFKNKNSRRAEAKIYIDGEHITDLVVPANGTAELECNPSTHKSFLFVDLNSTEAMLEGKAGGNPDKVKGLIEVQFHLEKEVPVYTPPVIIEKHVHHHNYPRYGSIRGVSWDTLTTGNAVDGISLRSMLSDEYPVACAAPMSAAEASFGAVEDGCTAEGSYSSQSFRQVHFSIEDSYTTIKMFLRGVQGSIKEAEVAAVVNKSNLDLAAEARMLEKKIQEKLAEAAREKEKRELEAKIAELKAQLASM